MILVLSWLSAEILVHGVRVVGDLVKPVLVIGTHGGLGVNRFVAGDIESTLFCSPHDEVDFLRTCTKGNTSFDVFPRAG